MAIRYLHHVTKEPVELVGWQWEAYYLDGSVLKQYDKIDEEHGEFHNFHEIDQSRLRVFRMVDGNGQSVDVMFDPYKQREGRMKLVHKYINHGAIVQRVDETGHWQNVGEPVTARSFLFGYELDGYKHLLMITPNNRIVATNDPDEVEVVIHQEAQE